LELDERGGHRFPGGRFQLHLAIPRTALGLSGEGTAAAFDFKWVDHAQHPGEILDFYVNGDAAPEGRFNYRYLAD
jgi:hypothetical protein